MSYSGRVRAMIFSETFWKEIGNGKTKALIDRSADRRGWGDVMFAEFYEKYLNEFALAWGMREGTGGPVYEGCKTLGVEDATSCLKALLAFGSGPMEKCSLTLSDEMFAYLPQAIHDEAADHPR